MLGYFAILGKAWSLVSRDEDSIKLECLLSMSLFQIWLQALKLCKGIRPEPTPEDIRSSAFAHMTCATVRAISERRHENAIERRPYPHPRVPYQSIHFGHQSSRSAVELSPLDIDSVLADSHSQVLHRKNGPILAAALSTASVTWTLDTKRSTTSCLFLATWCSRLLACHRKPGSCSQITHGVVGI